MQMSVSETAKKLLMKHEGLRLKAYLCTAGKVTVGVGRNIEQKGITEEEAMYLLHNDIQEAAEYLKKFSFWAELNCARRVALIDMYHNVGATKFAQFKKMITAISEKDYAAAAAEMLDSKWAVQVGDRAYELAEIMKKGELII